jgi:phospholipid/cholesterol/gamma-HCH transport system permease protein
VLRFAGAPLRRAGDFLQDLGDQLSFHARVLFWVWRTLIRYKTEVFRLLADVSLGSGALIVVGGTVGVTAFICFFVGTEVGLEGYSALNQIGVSAFAGFVSAYFNTREIAPLVAGVAFAATVGCGFTAQLGAMRVSEEIDALEVMGVPSIPYLVTTRVIAALVAVTPLYLLGLLSSYLASRLIVTLEYHQSTGTYDHYFHLFLPPVDVFYSALKAVLFALIIVLVHCYYGYTARGGPAGVGVAVGKAVRTSLVAITLADFFLSLAIWGSNTTVRIAG